MSLTGLGTDFSIDNPRQVDWLSPMIPSSSNPLPRPIAHWRPTVGQGRGTRGKGQGRGQEKDGENIKPMKVKGSFTGKERWGAEQTQLQNLQSIPQWHREGRQAGGRWRCWPGPGPATQVLPIVGLNCLLTDFRLSLLQAAPKCLPPAISGWHRKATYVRCVLLKVASFTSPCLSLWRRSEGKRGKNRTAGSIRQELKRKRIPLSISLPKPDTARCHVKSPCWWLIVGGGLCAPAS